MRIFDEMESTLGLLDKLVDDLHKPTVVKGKLLKQFYLFSNKIYHDKETLDDTLYEYYASDNKSVDRIEMLVEYAYDNGTVGTVRLSYEELIQHLKHYEFIGGS